LDHDRIVASVFNQQHHNQTDIMTLIPMLADIQGNIHIAFAALGAALGIGLLGSKAAEATGRNPGASTAILVNAIIFAALAEGIFLIAFFVNK